MKPHFIAFAQQWHLERSEAFHDLLVEPLQSNADIELHGWDGTSLLPQIRAGQTYIFCQLPPPKDWLAKAPEQIIWIPMWDHDNYAAQKLWNRLPSQLRIVAFSNAVYQRAHRAGLKTLHLHYYKNPKQCTPVDWSGRRVLLYWNRIGLVSPAFLQRLCTTLHIDKLLFRSSPDPNVDEQLVYELPARLGTTVVENIPVFRTRQEYFAAAQEANIFLAPREAEGAGMTFLESMARGCAVFAHNKPTMNEYIQSGINGYLFKQQSVVERTMHSLRRKLAARVIGGFPSSRFIEREQDQDWQQIASLSLEQLGSTARRQHEHGYQQWQAQRRDYLRFLLGASELL